MLERPFEKERFHSAKAADITRQIKTQIRGDARAKKHIVAKIVDPQLQIAEPQRDPAVSEIGQNAAEQNYATEKSGL